MRGLGFFASIEHCQITASCFWFPGSCTALCLFALWPPFGADKFVSPKSKPQCGSGRVCFGDCFVLAAWTSLCHVWLPLASRLTQHNPGRHLALCGPSCHALPTRCTVDIFFRNYHLREKLQEKRPKIVVIFRAIKVAVRV